MDDSGFAGMMVLAVLICIPLWKLSHHDRTTENNEFAAVTTEAQSSEQASAETPETGIASEKVATAEPETTQIPETVTPEPAAAVTEAPQPTPTQAPEAQPQPTEAPVATEVPATNNTGDALAEEIP